MSKDTDNKKQIARTLFLSGMQQSEIAEKVQVSRVTISKWAKQGAWQETRAAKTITRPELVNKLLLTIDRLIEQVNQNNNPQEIASFGDKLAKLSSTIERLDKKTNVVDAIEVFMAFSNWMEFRAREDKEITLELLKTINRYQDKYIMELMNKQ